MANSLTKIDDRGLKTPIDLLDNEKIRFGTGNDLEAYHDGSQSIINDSSNELQIRSDQIKLMTASGKNEYYLIANEDGAVELYHNNGVKFATKSSGVTISGTASTILGDLHFNNDTNGGKDLLWDESANSVIHYDDVKAAFGVDSDLQIYHTGVYSLIANTTGDLVIRNTGDTYLQSDSNVIIGDVGNNEKFIKCVDDAAVELYYNNVKVCDTDPNGITVVGPEGGDGLIKLYADEGDDNADKYKLTALTNGNWEVQNYSSGSAWETNIRATGAGAASLYYDDAKKIETNSNGITVTGSSYHQVDGQGFLSGASNDLFIYHDGSDSWVKNDTGDLVLQSLGDDVILMANDDLLMYVQGGAEAAIVARNNGEVDLRYDGNTKFQTTSTGISVTGKVGINQASPTKMLHVVESSSASGNIVAKFKGGSGADSETFIAIVDGYSDTDNDLEGHVKIGAKRSGAGNTAHMVFHTYHSSSMAERMRITNSGKVLVGKDTDSTTHQPGLIIHTNGNICYAGDGTGDHDFAEFYRGTSGSYSRVGYIRTNGSATTYSTSSDYRLKENEVAISDGIARLKTLKPYKFNFKVDPDTKVDGFFAHEVTPAVPEAVTGEKDGTEMQGIDQSKLVPLLTAALQEAITKIETLETEVAALKAK